MLKFSVQNDNYSDHIYLKFSIKFQKKAQPTSWVDLIAFCCGGEESVFPDLYDFNEARGEAHFDFLMGNQSRFTTDPGTDLPPWERAKKNEKEGNQHYDYDDEDEIYCPECGSCHWDYIGDDEDSYHDYVCDDCGCEFVG